MNISVDKDCKILFISDLHAPFHDKRKLAKTIQLIKEIQPDYIIQLGDGMDMYSFSRFSKSTNLTTPKMEIKDAREVLTKMWSDIKTICPKAKRFALKGNHELRIYKSIMMKSPEYESIVEEPIQSIFEFPDVTTLKSHRDELHITHPKFGQIVCIHGWSCKPKNHMDHFSKNVVHAHSHRTHIVYRGGKSPIWELCCGHLSDPTTIPLSYGETQSSNWVHACGLIDKFGPRVITL